MIKMVCYNRKGKLISLQEYGKLFATKGYKIVLRTTLPNKKWVSTVWLGLDYSLGSTWTNKPLIFETMVFINKKKLHELDVERYSTEIEARKGHNKMCAKWV